MIENRPHVGETSGIHTIPETSPRVLHGSGASTAPVTATATMVAPTDRVRWGPIIAGLLTALSTLTVLSLLGLAIGLSTHDQGDSARALGIRAGWWGGISALLAFALGGWMAAHTAAVRGTGNGLLNGAMVWALAVPLLAWMAGSGIYTAASVAGQAAGTAAQTAATAANTPQGQDAARDVSSQAQAKAGEVMNQAKATLGDPATQQKAQDAATKTAWGMLISTLLALAAAAGGGFLGARKDHRHGAHAVSV